MTNAIQSFHLLVIALAGWVNRHQQAVIDYLIEENRVLKEQLEGQRLRFTDEQRMRLAVKAKVLGRQVLDEIETLVTPDTLLSWHRKLIAKKWTYARQGAGRPRVAQEITDLVLHMAGENASWGYDRIQGALTNLGHIIAPNTVKNILKRHGIEPAPGRDKRTSWKTFLKAHWDVLNSRYLIMDRDTKYTNDFREHLDREGVKPVRCPARAPNCNAFAERFVRSIKEECLDRMILFGEASLRRALREYVVHYQAERNHQGVGNRLLEPLAMVSSNDETIHRRERLGGMLNYYCREAA